MNWCDDNLQILDSFTVFLMSFVQTGDVGLLESIFTGLHSLTNAIWRELPNLSNLQNFLEMMSNYVVNNPQLTFKFKTSVFNGFVCQQLVSLYDINKISQTVHEFLMDLWCGAHGLAYIRK